MLILANVTAKSTKKIALSSTSFLLKWKTIYYTGSPEITWRCYPPLSRWHSIESQRTLSKNGVCIMLRYPLISASAFQLSGPKKHWNNEVFPGGPSLLKQTQAKKLAEKSSPSSAMIRQRQRKRERESERKKNDRTLFYWIFVILFLTTVYSHVLTSAHEAEKYLWRTRALTHTQSSTHETVTIE